MRSRYRRDVFRPERLSRIPSPALHQVTRRAASVGIIHFAAEAIVLRRRLIFDRGYANLPVRSCR
jgi:hypothetical protein